MNEDKLIGFVTFVAVEISKLFFIKQVAVEETGTDCYVCFKGTMSRFNVSIAQYGAVLPMRNSFDLRPIWQPELLLGTQL